MLTTNEARKIGVRACMEKIGVNDTPTPDYDISKVTRLVLTSGEKWKYSARCHVDKISGTVFFVEPY